MRFNTKSLTFPTAGVSRSRVNREQTRPYTAPWAVNVRSRDPVEDRLRGGSRPGFVKVSDIKFGDAITAVAAVTHIDDSGVRHRDLVVVADGSFSTVRGAAVSVPDTALHTEGGVAILDDEGRELIFNAAVGIAPPGALSAAFSTAERNGKILVADSRLHVFDPILGTVEEVVATKGTVPQGQPIVAVYRDRAILGGADHVWYASRQGFIDDWHFGADMGDLGRAVASSLERAGHIGEPITAIIPHGDSILTLATANSLWALHGDPADGKLMRLSSEIGVITHNAWASATEGVQTLFLSHDGLYLLTPGEHPVRFSAERVPDVLQDADISACTVTMAYDANERGYHLFITPHPDRDGKTAQATHWWIDIENKAVWPVVLPAAMQPVAATRRVGEGALSDVVFGCRDGYLRKFDRAAAADDGTPVESHVLLGPFRLVSDDISAAMLTEVHGMFGSGTSGVTCRVVMADSAEECAAKAVAGIEAAKAGGAVTGVAYTCEMGGPRNKVFRPRARGAWGIIWLAADSAWAYESVAIKLAHLGRIR